MSSVTLSTEMNVLNPDWPQADEIPVKGEEIRPTGAEPQTRRYRPENFEKALDSSNTREVDAKKEAALPLPIRKRSFGSKPGPSTSQTEKRLPKNRNRKSTRRKSQAKSKGSESAEVDTDSAIKFAYVVEACMKDPMKEKTLGVFTNLAAANETAIKFAEQNGTQRNDIVDIVSSINIEEKDKPVLSTGKGRATRRTWKDGTIDIQPRIVSGKFFFIRVLPKELASSSEKREEKDKVYLAVEKSKSKLYVGGAFWTKDEAWEACKKYWPQNLLSRPIERRDEWVDEQGMGHVEGAFGETSYHWFVEAYRFREKAD
jgi:hypothetical protein